MTTIGAAYVLGTDTRCDRCAAHGVQSPAVVDAPVWPGGPWAYLCHAHARRAGVRVVDESPPRGAA